MKPTGLLHVTIGDKPDTAGNVKQDHGMVAAKGATPNAGWRGAASQNITKLNHHKTTTTKRTSQNELKDLLPTVGLC